MTGPVLTTEEYEALSDYDRGVIDGMHMCAWWKDGTMYVGTIGTTYRQAVERHLRRRAASSQSHPQER